MDNYKKYTEIKKENKKNISFYIVSAFDIIIY